MALTQVNRGGLNTGVSDSSNATFLTVDSSEQAIIKSEGGASTTSVQQGLAKFWANIDQVGTAALVDSLNCSGITDNAGGDISVALSTNMGNATYAPSGMTTSHAAGGGSGEDEGFVSIDTKARMTTSANRFHTTDGHNGSDQIDYDPVCVIFHGDLA